MRGLALRRLIEFSNRCVLLPLLQWIYPTNCILCESSEIEGLNQVCNKCWHQLPRTTDTAISNLWLVREEDLLVFIARFHAFFDFNEGIQKIIHEMKYNGKTRIAREIIRFLKKDISNHFHEIEIIIPIPLHTKRQKERGYNQSELLAREIAIILEKPFFTNVVKRVTNTKSQTQLDAHERLENMAGAFSVSDNQKIQEKVILLIDDLITTGSTLNECARILKENKAKEVYALALARA
ncbi:ComF family protein [candidate division KSB1 bacterium]|nr:ComF family protein [candidate division KSB1 bacterium]